MLCFCCMEKCSFLAKMARTVLGLVLLCLIGCQATTATVKINPDISIKEATRVIDLTSQLVKTSTELTLENSGKSPVSSFLFVLEPALKNKLSYISASSGDSKNSIKLQTSLTKVAGHESSGNIFYVIALNDQLKPGKAVTVTVETVGVKQLVPHPEQITQKEKQLVIYTGNHYILSPYVVQKQTTRVTLASKNIESFSKLKPFSQNGEVLHYGRYENVPPFSEDVMTIHFENNAPFLTINSLHRSIEVSHWGNIAIEESIDLEHTGAKLKGPFSRFEYQREMQSGLSSIRSFKTVLPASAVDVYYRDEIGNISTSNMKIHTDSVEVDLHPRFPLFGGWKTHYTIGYNVPSYEYLYNSGNQYLLKIRFLDHVFDDQVVDDIVTRIVLPEGSQNIKVVTPFPLDRLPDSLLFTYLDTTGRPVVSLHGRNLVENHIQDIEIHYTFPRILMLQEPLLVVIALFLLFLLIIVYVRLDFSITKDQLSENKLRVAGHLDKIIGHYNKRLATYEQLDDLLTKLKLSKDVSTFQTAVKSINNDYKNETSQINEILKKLKVDGPDAAEKVAELQKTDKALKDVYQEHQLLYVDKLVPGKITRAAFTSEEATISKKKNECAEKLKTSLNALSRDA